MNRSSKPLSFHAWPKFRRRNQALPIFPRGGFLIAIATQFNLSKLLRLFSAVNLLKLQKDPFPRESSKTSVIPSSNPEKIILFCFSQINPVRWPHFALNLPSTPKLQQQPFDATEKNSVILTLLKANFALSNKQNLRDPEAYP